MHLLQRTIAFAGIVGALGLASGQPAAAERAEAPPTSLHSQIEPIRRPFPVMPEHLAGGFPYEGYLQQVTLRLADLDLWIEQLRAAAAERGGEARETMAQLARNVERELEQAEEQLAQLRETDITRRGSAREDVDHALRELTRAHDEARAALRAARINWEDTQ